MSAPVPPRFPRVRDALLAHAERLSALPLTLVVAPAGSGKSTLLGAWRSRLAGFGTPTGYVDLSPLHADATVLAADLFDVVRRALPEFGAETARELAHQRDAGDVWRVLARAWLRDWSAAGEEFVLVLDNFQEIPGDASGPRLLDELLRALPTNLHLVVASRGVVPAAAARLRAAGGVVEVGLEQLSLRSEEVESILAEHSAGGDSDVAARLLARTGGWAAGVQLAARRLAHIEPGDRAAFVAQLGREPDLFRFVATEVLRDEPDALLAAVEAVSLLGRCDAADVAELLDDPRAADQVARAIDRGVLLTDGREIWIHQLWRDLLANRLEARLSETERRALLRRTGTQLRRRARYEGALEAFAGAQDFAAMASTLIEAADGWAREGRAERLRFWLAQLPDTVVDATPVLLALRGIALVRATPQQALPILERAAQMYRARGDRAQERALAGYIGVLHMTQLRRLDALRSMRRMITLRGVITDSAERGALYALLAQRRYLTGRFGGALTMAERAQSHALDGMTDWFNSMLLTWLRTIRGEWDEALELVQRQLDRPEINGHLFLYSATLLQRASVWTRRGAFEQAGADAARADEGLREHRLPVLRELAPMALGMVHSRLGDRDAAKQWFEEALQRARAMGGGAEGPAHAQQAIEMLRWGEVEAAALEARRAVAASGAPGERWSVLTPWVLCYALWVLGRSDAREAWRIAQRYRNAFDKPELGVTHFTMQLALADLARDAGDASEAQRLARGAFEGAARFGVRVVEPLIGGFVTPQWAEWAVREGVCEDYALGRLAATGPTRVIPLLQELARDANTAQRERAVRLLALRGGRDAFEPLHAASEDRVARVREAAAAALARLDLRPPFALRVRSLGGFEVSRGDARVAPDEWKGQTARRLFARLLVAEGRAVARERLREDLWPDLEPEAGRNNLRVATTRLNDALDPERPPGAAPHFVVTEGESLRLQEDALSEWDVAQFRAQLRAAEESERSGADARALAQTCEALALHGGPLLPDQDEAWLLPLRRELAERFAAAAQRAGPRLLRRGRVDEAIALAERLLTADPADEHAFALRMRALLARGDRATALRSYDEAVAALRRELDIEPGAELQQLATQARSS